MEVYFFDAVKHPPARMRWEERREACQDWHDHYEEIRQMTNKIKDAVGVVERGPDDPALARAKARDEGGVVVPDRSTAYLAYTDDCRRRGEHALNYEDWAEGQMPRVSLLGASVGAVDRQQGGILPTRTGRRTEITPDMVGAGRRAAAAAGAALDHGVVEAILEAALHGE